MKNSKKMFILTETVLAAMVIVMALIMIREKNGKELDKVSVIIQNSDDNRWSAFKYGLKMAAEDQKIKLSVVSTGGTLTVEEEMSVVEREIDNGAGAVIVQPVAGAEAVLKKIESKVPVMLVEHMVSDDGEASALPSVEPDHYDMGTALAEELLKDYNGKIDGKTLGILSETDDTKTARDRIRGFTDALKDTGAKVSWSHAGSLAKAEETSLEAQPKVDFVIALDDDSLTTAGQYSAANHLRGALVYGIGNSTEAVYYLDTGIVGCLVVPDEFSAGYQSLTEAAACLRHYFRKMQDRRVSYTVIRRDTLFSKENQEILFTMSQ